MITSYSTISAPSEGQFRDRGSRFIAFAYPVNNEEEIKEKIDQLRRQYHDARHHCYGWKLGTDPVSFRANDDGEPSSSAGKPILNQIESFGLTNVLVVVIRYFGGTLLGVGGLINAYRTAAEEALRNSSIIVKQIQRYYLLRFQYPAMNDVMKVIKEHKLETSGQLFEIACSLRFRVDLVTEKVVLEKLKMIETCILEPIENE